MDLKNKLEQLKRERKIRSKSQWVKDTWKEVGKDEELSTKEKLEHLINLTREEKKPRQKMPAFEALPREPLQFFEIPYDLDAKYGNINLSLGLEVERDILIWLSNDQAFENLDLSTALFIDLETTGLSGGAGVVPFNIGMGYYRDDKFMVAQYFLGDLAEEEIMIKELGQFFSENNFQSVVTYNGKNFDLPILETRFILYRKPFLLGKLPHLDFLYPARMLWKHKYENCRLFHLAREEIGADRSEDIASAEIPMIYFRYLETGDFELVEPILYHNREDILSLLGIVIAGALIFSEDKEKFMADAMDFYGAGRVMEKRGAVEKSAYFFQRALKTGLPEEISLQAKKKVSYYFKKSENWGKAVSLWQEIASLENPSMQQLYSIRELAMYHEHKQKKYEEAKEITEEGLVLSLNFSPFYEKDFSHRLERLNKKIRRQKQREV